MEHPTSERIEPLKIKTILLKVSQERFDKWSRHKEILGSTKWEQYFETCTDKAEAIEEYLEWKREEN